MLKLSAASRPWSGASRLAEQVARIAELPFLVAIRVALPWSFLGLIIAFAFIIPFVHEAGPFFGPSLGLRVSAALLPAFGVMGAILAPSLAWQYARRASLDPLPLVAGTVFAYAIALPPYHPPAMEYGRAVGPSGLFLAILACGAVAMGAKFARSAWVGAVVAMLISIALRAMHWSVALAITAALAPLAHLGDTYLALLLIVLIETLLWTCGIHGPAMLAAVVTPVYLTLQMQNTQAFSHHAPLPNIVVVSLFLFVFPGGAGATLPLAALLAVSRVARLRRIGRITVVPAIFNTNEPLLFGAPVVFNPFLIPPFIIAPLILASTTYAAVILGWVDRPAFYVPSSIPTIISTYIATLDPRAVALVAINLAIATVVYWPFVRAYERHLEASA